MSGIDAKEIDIIESSRNLEFEKLVGIPILTGWFGEGDDGEIVPLPEEVDHLLLLQTAVLKTGIMERVMESRDLILDGA